jgi:eukaryotic-like serine/threonine-protein kinase
VEELKTLGRYKIQGVLGKGAMGLVYDGLDPNLDRRVAIKTILTRKLDAEAARMITVRFEREVRAVARLNHRNIVQVYDFGAEGELAYIVMEHIQGKELKDFFDANERFDVRKIFTLMIELLDALEFAHEAGIVHRDIKPGNVMIDAAGHVKLTDFGVARVNDPDGPQAEATRVGAQVGTPAYMSPEQVQGQKVDRRSDVFSAGIIFYQFLTGQKPFEGSQFTLQQKIVMEDPVWPSAIVQVPAEYDRVIARAMAKEVEQRYQSARAFADALKRILEGKPPEDPNEVLAKPLPMPSVAPSAQESEAEAEFWEEVKDSEDPEDLKLYVEQFPHGKFVAQAKKKIAALGGG